MLPRWAASVVLSVLVVERVACQSTPPPEEELAKLLNGCMMYVYPPCNVKNMLGYQEVGGYVDVA